MEVIFATDLDFGRSLRPLGVKDAFLVDPLIGVGTEVIPLSLGQVLR